MSPHAVFTVPQTPAVQTSAMVGQVWHWCALQYSPLGQPPQRTFLQPSFRSPHSQAGSPEALGSGFWQLAPPP